jgi:hypothetical protein
MSYVDYRVSQQMAAIDYPFYAIIMAAMRKADNHNLARLKVAFPETWKELDIRYNTPGGIVPGERISE